MTLVPQPLAASLDEVVGAITSRTALSASDSKSGATFERIGTADGVFVVKRLRAEDDWIMRASGDVIGRPRQCWEAGLMTAAPDIIESAVVGCVVDDDGALLVMRDVAPHLVPEGSATLPAEQHDAFLRHMAGLHARLWEWEDTIGLLSPDDRYREFDLRMVERERSLGFPAPVPRIVGEGWERFPSVVPADVADGVRELLAEPAPFLAALEATPSCFLHGDWKLGNLGSAPDGRTILLDWAMPGRGAPLSELAWYLALNTDRLPEPKEAAVARYRAALVAAGIDVDGWFEQQAALAWLGALMQFGWEKSLGGPGAELDWWLAGAREGLRRV